MKDPTFMLELNQSCQGKLRQDPKCEDLLYWLVERPYPNEAAKFYQLCMTGDQSIFEIEDVCQNFIQDCMNESFEACRYIHNKCGNKFEEKLSLNSIPEINDELEKQNILVQT